MVRREIICVFTNLEDFPLVVDVLDLVVSDHLIDRQNFQRLILLTICLLCFLLQCTEVDPRKRSWNVKIR